MGPVESIVTTAWTDIQSRFGLLATEKYLDVPTYAYGSADWLSRYKYPVLFLTVDNVRQETSGIGAEELRVSLDLVLAQTANKPETLESEVMQYTDCMLELIRDDHTFGGACHIGEFIASELYAGSEQDRDIAIAIITILLRKEVQI